MYLSRNATYTKPNCNIFKTPSQKIKYTGCPKKKKRSPTSNFDYSQMTWSFEVTCILFWSLFISRSNDIPFTIVKHKAALDQLQKGFQILDCWTRLRTKQTSLKVSFYTMKRRFLFSNFPCLSVNIFVCKFVYIVHTD